VCVAWHEGGLFVARDSTGLTEQVDGYEEDVRRRRRNATNAQVALLILVAQLAAREPCEDRNVFALRVNCEAGPVCLLDLVEDDLRVDAALREHEDVRSVLGDELTDQRTFGVLGVPEEKGHHDDTQAYMTTSTKRRWRHLRRSLRWRKVRLG